METKSSSWLLRAWKLCVFASWLHYSDDRVLLWLVTVYSLVAGYCLMTINYIVV